MYSKYLFFPTDFVRYQKIFLCLILGDEDVRITDDFIDCTFARDIKNINFSSNNSANLEMLLYQFFEFYSVFDFSTLAISLNAGKSVKKPDFSPLYIVNPLETKLNVSKNVSHDEVNKIKMELKNASWHIETFNNIDKDVNKLWGLGILFKNDPKIVNKKIAELTRLLSIKDLFSGETKIVIEDEKDHMYNSSEKDFDDPEKTSNTAQKEPFFKNQSVKNEINNIKRSTAEAINQIEKLYDDSHENKSNYSFDRRKFKR